MVGFTAYLIVTGHLLTGAIYGAVSVAAGIYALRRDWNPR
jgi:hypothetical protein